MNIKEKFEIMFPFTFPEDPVYPLGYSGKAYKVMERGIREQTYIRRMTKEEKFLMEKFEKIIC